MKLDSISEIVYLKFNCTTIKPFLCLFARNLILVFQEILVEMLFGLYVNNLILVFPFYQFQCILSISFHRKQTQPYLNSFGYILQFIHLLPLLLIKELVIMSAINKIKKTFRVSR